MNSDTYVECLVAHKSSPIMKFLKILLIMLAVAFVFLGLLGTFAALILGIVFGGLAYFVSQQCTIEYEYLYLDREISIDRIMARSKRKKVATFDVEKMEILAPINSYHLDDYKNRQIKPTDYSSGVAKQPDRRYVFFYEGQKKVILEPSSEFVKAVYNVAPRKVFTD